MKEYIFRGIDLLSGEMVYGGGIDTHRDTPAIINNCIKTYVKPGSIGQYSGIKDREGKKLFEGDICQFIRSGFEYTSTLRDVSSASSFVDTPCKFTVIGNEHQKDKVKW